MVYGFILVLGASTGNSRLFSPLANVTGALSRNSDVSGSAQSVHDGFIRVKTIADVEKIIEESNAQGKTVMFDYFAESCTACYEFADYTFPAPSVQRALKNTVLIQADVTANDAEDKALMKHYDVKGLPSILFFDLEGIEDKRLRAIGFENADVFTQRINAAFKNK